MRSEEVAARARSFGQVADDYDEARPGYPPDAVAWLLGASPLDVVDLGAGTGKLTGVLLAAGHRVVAVEPLDELRAKLAEALPGVRAVGGRAEAIPLPDASADAVVAAQAFHWFDPEPALAEIARVLAPGGTLGVIWNVRDESQGWMRELTRIADGPESRTVGWSALLESLPHVASVQRRDFRLEHAVDRALLLALVRSWSYVSSLPAPEHRRVLAEVDGLWDSHPDLRGREEAALTYRTEAYRCLVR
jgi:SAM-dependent methyltransferase